MRLAVLGATGRTGSLIVDRARAVGHEVVRVVRRPDDPDADADTRLADGRDARALAAAIRGCDAVAFAIGPTAQTEDPTLMRESMTATVEAMVAEGVRRLVVVGADGPWRGSGDPLIRFVAKPILGRVLPESMADFVATERVVRASALDWTIVRPAQLHDGRSPRARRRRDKSNWFGMRTSRTATAAAVVDLLPDRDSVGSSFAVTT